MIIGLTGGSGSGKSIVARAALDAGFKVIDADKVGHSIMQQGTAAYTAIIDHFGTGILKPNGDIDRRRLGEIVFSDKAQLQSLNQITHREITRAILPQLEGNIVIDGAVLHATPLFEQCGIIVAVTTPAERRIEFILRRDGISREAAENRIKSQLTNDEYESMADIILHNDSTEMDLYEKASRLFREVNSG